MYNAKSNIASEFISHTEILDTLDYATVNKYNRQLIDDTLSKATEGKGLTHREAALLLECDDEEVTQQIFDLASQIKERIYGRRIVIFAPLYLSNYCINGCLYCPYRVGNKDITRKKLSQSQIQNEVIALQDMGHKRLVLETGEDPRNSSIEYLLESIKTIYNVKHRNGAIRRVNVNVAATTVENYRKLHDAGIGTYTLFQETYHRESYERLHPSGPKSDYAYHTEAMDRAMEGGVDDVGLGVLFGLNTYRYDFVGMMMHNEHLEARFGVGAHTISVPRICPANGVDTADYDNAISDDLFKKIVAISRITLPYAGIIISTRESQRIREEVLPLGVSQISGGSRTTVGGYGDDDNNSNVDNNNNETSAQFDISDNRTLDSIIKWLVELGYIPSFCTACYREGRTGDRFMSLVKTGNISSCCTPNALITLKEYLEDYASCATKECGNALISKAIESIPNDAIRRRVEKNMGEIELGDRDFRF
ncbi:MAG: [FeFe] hydrogenase H-cluster radical SAM maturase HydG [Rikenellaceae bacterium]